MGSTDRFSKAGSVSTSFPFVLRVCVRRIAGRRAPVSSTNVSSTQVSTGTALPASGAPSLLGKGVTAVQGGPIDRMLLAVSDIEAARAELVSRGIEVGEVFHDAADGLGAGFNPRKEAHAPGLDPQHRSYASYATFNDPDGNVWMLQDLRERLPGRV